MARIDLRIGNHPSKRPPPDRYLVLLITLARHCTGAAPPTASASRRLGENAFQINYFYAHNRSACEPGAGIEPGPLARAHTPSVGVRGRGRRESHTPPDPGPTRPAPPTPTPATPSRAQRGDPPFPAIAVDFSRPAFAAVPRSGLRVAFRAGAEPDIPCSRIVKPFGFEAFFDFLQFIRRDYRVNRGKRAEIRVNPCFITASSFRWEHIGPERCSDDPGVAGRERTAQVKTASHHPGGYPD